MNEIEGLQKARDLIAAGWCQHTVSSGNKLCIVGAIRKSAGDSLHVHRFGGLADKAMTILDKYVPSETEAANPDYYTPIQRLPAFNDDSRTTQTDVLNLFDKAIANEGGAV